MNYTTVQEAVEQADLPVEVETWSVYRTFEKVTDGREKRGIRYSVALILTLIVLAKLAGMTTPLAIAEWVRLRAGWLSKVLPVTRTSFPCASTYSNVLQTLDAEQVNEVVTQVLTRVGAMKRCGEEPSRRLRQAEREAHAHVALDGKTLRGTLGHEAADQRMMLLLALHETGTGLVRKRAGGGRQRERTLDCLAVPEPAVGQRTHHLRRCSAHPTHLLQRSHPRRRLLPAHGQRQSADLA